MHSLHRLWFVWLLASCVVGVSEAQTPSDGPKLLRLLKEAQRNAMAPRAGRGHGRAVVSGRTYAVKGSEWKNEAKISTEFKNGRCRIGMEFDEDYVQAGGKKKVIITDNEMCFVARFSPRINPTGCTSFIHPRGGLSPAGTAGFNFDPVNQVQSLPNLNSWKGGEFKLTVLPTGDIRGVAQLAGGPSYCELLASPRSGYNIYDFKIFRGPATLPQLHVKLEWHMSEDGAWYRKRSDMTEVSYQDNIAVDESRTEISYDEFSPNAEVDDSTFSLDSVGLAPGSRILDDRPSAKVKEYYYREGAIGTSEGHLDSLLSSLSTLPTSKSDAAPPRGRLMTDWLIMAFGILAVAGLGWYYIPRAKAGKFPFIGPKRDSAAD